MYARGQCGLGGLWADILNIGTLYPFTGSYHWAVALELIWKWGHRSGAKVGAPHRKIFFGRAPPLFGSKSTISRFCERFRDGQYSLISFLFAVLLLTVPPCPAICKSGEGYVPPALWRRRHWTQLTKTNYRPCPLNAAHFSTVAYMDWKAKLIATPLLLIFLFKFICLLSK